MRKCKFCDKEAVIYLRYANASFCKDHFVKMFERRVLRTIHRYGLVERGDRILVAVSGGKDSAVLLYVLAKFARELGASVEAVFIDLGIPGYSELCSKATEELCTAINVKLNIVRISELEGFTLLDVKTAYRRKVCSLCGVIKRYILNKYAFYGKFTKVATGHNLDDMAYVLLSGYIRGDLETLLKVYPISPGKGKLVTRIKPLAETPEDDIKLYASLMGLPYVTEKCPFSHSAKSLKLKLLLNELEEIQPSSKIAFVRNFLKYIHPVLKRHYSVEQAYSECRLCGMPSLGDICAFCRIKERIMSMKGGCT